MSKQSVAVRIAGHQYKIRSDGDPSALQEIASYVDKAMDRVRARTGTVDTLDVAVLTCLNLAREILVLRDGHNGAVRDERMRSLIERVETILDADSLSRIDADAGRAADRATDISKRDAETRTLELPSVEVLHDRTATVSGARSGESESDGTGAAAMPEARAAAGGRERAS